MSEKHFRIFQRVLSSPDSVTRITHIQQALDGLTIQEACDLLSVVRASLVNSRVKDLHVPELTDIEIKINQRSVPGPLISDNPLLTESCAP